jgi:nucleolar protein 56
MIVEKTLYPKDPDQIATALSRQLEGEVTREVSETVERLIQRGFRTLVFQNRALAEAVSRRCGLEVEVRTGTEASGFLRDKLEKLAIEFRIVEDSSKFYGLSHEVSRLMAIKAVRRAFSGRELMISRVVQLLGDLDRGLNSFSSRLKEWYGIHFPELSRLVENHRAYADIIGTLGDRTHFQLEALINLGVSRAKAETIYREAQDSMGAHIGQDDVTQVMKLASHLSALYQYRGDLEEYLSAMTEEIAPNLTEVAGPVIAAKLIDKAGGLRKLAMMPSSTIQLLGAEKAMFRALKSGSKPPKHGFIFQHSAVRTSPRRKRGRLARALAAKLAIAARVDAFSGKSLGAQLKSEFESKIDDHRSIDRSTRK